MVETRRPIDFKRRFGSETGSVLNNVFQGIESPSVAATQDTFRSDRYALRAAGHGVNDALLWYPAPQLVAGWLMWLGAHVTPLSPVIIAGDFLLAAYAMKKFGDM